MLAKISSLYQEIGMIELENLKIGSNKKTSDFTFFKLSHFEKLLTSSNVDWNKLGVSKNDILNQIDSLKII